MSRSEMYTVAFDEILSETDKAWLFDFMESEHWLPKSQCEIVEGGQEGGYVSVPEWLLIDKEIDYL